MFGYSKKMWVPQNKEQKKQYYQAPRFNANVFKIDFKILAQKDKIAMGDPIFCKKCAAAVSCLSKPEKIDENTYKWVCEFCSQENILENIEEEEIPKEEDLCYVLQSKDQKNDEMVDENAENQDISIVFCIDFSGSMNATQELKNKNSLNIDNQQLQELENFKQFMEPNEYQQYKQMVMQQMNKFISRKDCVLAAIKDQVLELKKSHPNRKIGIVTFNDDVVVLGDGISENEQTITGDKLFDFNVVYEESKKYANTHMKVPVSQSSENLINKFQQLKPVGKTALAPALLTSIGLIENAKAGSQIILCTDGLANQGFGSLDVDTDEQQQAQEVFYQQIGDLAIEKGVKLSVITVKGEECKVIVLGQLADKTQGKVTRVNPENIHNDFASILKDEVLATQTQLKVWIHKGLQFKNTEIEEMVDIIDDCYNRKIGNVTQKTQISFEYDLKNEEDLKKLELDIEKLGNLPFQAQIRYNNPNGDSMIRILSKNQEIAQDENEVHQLGDIDVIQGHQHNLNRNQALKGNFGHVSQQQNQYNQFLSTNLTNNNFGSCQQQQQVQQAFQKEQRMTKLNNKKGQMATKMKMKKSCNNQQQQQQQSSQNNFQNYQQNDFFGSMGGMGGMGGQGGQGGMQQPQYQQQQLQSNNQMGGLFGSNQSNNNNNYNIPQMPQMQQQQQLQQNYKIPPPPPPQSMQFMQAPQPQLQQEEEEDEDMDDIDAALFGDEEE